MKKQIIDRLLETELFVNADREKLEKVFLSDGCNVQKYHSGDEIDICSKIAFVAEGSVYVYSIDDKRKLLLRKIEAGEIFGVAGLFSKCNKMSKCFSKGNSEILFFDKTSVGKLLENDTEIMYNYISFLSGRINYLNKKITYLTAGTAERKLAVYLAGFDSENVSIKISYSALSDMLDIGRASLYRAFDRFVSDGCIIREGNNITILNKAMMLEKY